MKNIKISDLENAILALTDASDIRRVINAIREVQSGRSEAAMDNIKRGDKVRFVVRGSPIVGTVFKKNRKTVALRDCHYEGTTMRVVDYRVSATLCTKVA